MYLHTGDVLNCIQMVRPNRLRVWCPSATMLEDVVNTGLTIRGHPLCIKNLWWTDVGKLSLTCHMVYQSKRFANSFPTLAKSEASDLSSFTKVLMALHKTIPTRIRVLGHAGLVYHPGQARTCFHCGALGHESKHCPGRLHLQSPGGRDGVQRKHQLPSRLTTSPTILDP